MELSLQRFSDNGRNTLGLLFVDGKFECFTLEDTFQEEKIYGETRIPAGRYKIELRTGGQKHEKYKAKFKNHIGMLWLKDVPGFQYIYIHIGNSEKDSLGCILAGTQAVSNVYTNGFISGSALAYFHLYDKVAPAIARGKDVYITVTDEEFRKG